MTEWGQAVAVVVVVVVVVVAVAVAVAVVAVLVSGLEPGSVQVLDWVQALDLAPVPE